jgi:hypothetical protein
MSMSVQEQDQQNLAIPSKREVIHCVCYDLYRDFNGAIRAISTSNNVYGVAHVVRINSKQKPKQSHANRKNEKASIRNIKSVEKCS